MLWLGGEVQDEFLRLARLLDPDTQKQIFEPGFLLRHVREIKTCFDPKIVPTIDKLKQGRCNYPEELTVRTHLWRGRGKARCKVSVKDGVYFCHLPRHREFALMNKLPLNWKQLPEGTVTFERKPQEEKRGFKVDDNPLRPSFRPIKKVYPVKKNYKKGKSEDEKPPEQADTIAEATDDFDDVSIDRIIDRILLQNGQTRTIKASDLTVEQPEADSLDQCAFIDPLTQVACHATGVHEDVESPCLFCSNHITVPDELVLRVKQSGNSMLLRDLTTIISIDKELQALSSDASSNERKKLSRRRFVLASNQGFGNPSHIVRWARG